MPGDGPELEPERKGGPFSSLFNASMFQSLRFKDFRWLWLSTFASFMAVGMQIITRGWLVLRLSDDSPFALSIIMVSFALPMTVMSLLGGALADRMSRKHIIMACQIGNALLTSLLATLDMTGLIRFWHLVAIGMGNGTLVAINMPSRQALISDIVPADKLMNAISLNNSGSNITRTIGPAVAGLLIIYIDTWGVFYIVAAFFLFSMLAAAMIGNVTEPSNNARKGMASDIKEGVKYLIGDPRLRGLVITLFMPVFFGFSFLTLLPAWAREALDVQSDELGLLMMFMGLGSILGTLILAAIQNLPRRGMALLANGFLWGIFLAVFSRSTSYSAALPLLFFVGLLTAIFMSLNMTLMQMYSAPEMRGRIMSFGMMTFGAMPLSALPFGALAEKIGTPNALAISGIMLALFSLVFTLASPGFRKID
ncbi:MAG: MFS transporter [Deltaproteobacteria bacterium]|nr:MFS transporter [Deltaproteobacteria bacterium]